MMPGSPFARFSALAGLITLAGLATAFATTGGSIFSPGDLRVADSTPSRLGGVVSHAELKGKCGACHAGPGSNRPMALRCLECHEDIQRAIRDTATLHGTLADARACRTCHTEHQGDQGELTRFAGFGTAHGQFGFALDAHRRTEAGRPFSCRDCHAAGSFRFEAARCEACHRDYQAPFMAGHVAEWGRRCLSCHDGRDRFSKGRFQHAATAFPLDGAHLRASCRSCHPGVTDSASFTNAPIECVGCHESKDKHRGSLGRDCASCHTTTTWSGATFSHDVFPVDHGARGPSECRTCHQDAKNYKVYTCYNCHEHSPARVQQQHRGEVRGGRLDDCLTCHRGGRKHGDGDGGGDGEDH